jgi:hypothetical protein
MQTHTAPVNTDKSANKPGRISGKASAHAACKHNQPGCSHMRAAGLGPSMDAVILERFQTLELNVNPMMNPTCFCSLQQQSQKRIARRRLG